MTTSALREFMPYGAPELIEGTSHRLFRSTLSGVGLWAAAFLIVLGVTLARVQHRVVERTIVVPYRELSAPPPLTQTAPPPEIAIVRSVAAPTVGVAVPVPDTEAPPEQTIASQQEIAAATGSVAEAQGVQTIVVPEPAAEELPKLNDYVYADELPVLITDVRPVFPEIAREAGAEGEVLLRVLVGKDGHVRDVHVDQSMPMFDDAATEAAWHWVFKPALSGNQPVAVWISRRLKFSLRNSP